MGLFGNVFGGSLSPMGGSWGDGDDYVTPGMKRAWETSDSEHNWYGYFETKEEVVRFLDLVCEVDVDSGDRAIVRPTEVNRSCPFITAEMGLNMWKNQHNRWQPDGISSGRKIDGQILQLAEFEKTAHIITNDRYRDYAEMHPWLNDRGAVNRLHGVNVVPMCNDMSRILVAGFNLDITVRA